VLALAAVLFTTLIAIRPICFYLISKFETVLLLRLELFLILVQF